MHTRLILAALAVTGLLACAGNAAAQARTRVKITSVQVGLPAGPFSGEYDEDGRKRPLFKAGAWTPVWVGLECIGKIDEPLELVVEAPDSDPLVAVTAVPLPPMQPGDRRSGTELPFVPFVKPGGYFAELTVRVRNANDQNYAEPFRRTFYGMEASRYLVLSVGSSLASMRLPRTEGAEAGEAGDARSLRGGRVELAEILDPAQLPDQWFGYQGVDLVMIGTGADTKFFDTLAQPRYQTRRLALREWVRRGGRIMVSVGANPDVLTNLPELQDVLPARIDPAGKRTVDAVRLNWNNPRGAGPPVEPLRGKVSLSAVARKPDRNFRVLISSVEAGAAGTNPLAVEGAYGMGRATLVGFDLDAGPVTEWKYRAGLWEWLLSESGGHLPTGTESSVRSGSRIVGDENDDQLNRLQESLDYFEGVPVISFGWVALFILAYIIIIGPLDYLFLKKVVKRLEWTWVTFPAVVIAVSAIAYFAAYALKGRDMKVNKIDLVDIDLQTKRSYGTTWFTVFSPRIQNYTVGVEPAGPQPGDEPGKAYWTPDGPAETAPDTVVTWMGRARGGEQRLFTRRYQYHSEIDPQHPDRLRFATGLESVPIQVWSTKAFTANWSARIDPNRPLVVSTLRHPPGDPTAIVGEVTSNVPGGELQDVQLVYQGNVYPLRTLVPGVPRSVTGQNRTPVGQWLQSVSLEPLTSGYQPRRYSSPGVPPEFRLWPALFYETLDVSGSASRNASLRDLDQSWRLSPENHDEAILLARVAAPAGKKELPAEEVMQDPQTPTRLWLSELPGGKSSRTPLQGMVRQETYIRVFIPIPPAERAGKK